MSDMQEIFLSREDKFHGRVVSVHVDQVRLPNGHQSFREVVDHNGGVASLALDDDNTVLTVSGDFVASARKSASFSFCLKIPKPSVVRICPSITHKSFRRSYLPSTMTG